MPDFIVIVQVYAFPDHLAAGRWAGDIEGAAHAHWEFGGKVRHLCYSNIETQRNAILLTHGKNVRCFSWEVNNDGMLQPSRDVQPRT